MMGACFRSGGDLGGFRPGEPRWGGLVEGLGEDSGPVGDTFTNILLYNMLVITVYGLGDCHAWTEGGEKYIHITAGENVVCRKWKNVTLWLKKNKNKTKTHPLGCWILMPPKWEWGEKKWIKWWSKPKRWQKQVEKWESSTRNRLSDSRIYFMVLGCLI